MSSNNTIFNICYDFGSMIIILPNDVFGDIMVLASPPAVSARRL